MSQADKRWYESILRFLSKPKVIIFILSLLVVSLAWGTTTTYFTWKKDRLLKKSNKEVQRLLGEYNHLSAATKSVVKLLKEKDKEIVLLQHQVGVKKQVVQSKQTKILKDLEKSVKRATTLPSSKIVEELTKLGY